MTKKQIVEYANFYEKYRYNNEYILLSDYKFLLMYIKKIRLNTYND